MQNFVFDMPTKIFFGKEQIQSLETELSGRANNILIVYGSPRIKENGLLGSITAILVFMMTIKELDGLENEVYSALEA